MAILFGVGMIALIADCAHAAAVRSLQTHWQTAAIRSEADLDRVIAGLRESGTRLESFMFLLEFAGYPKGNTRSDVPGVNALHSKAMNAMHACPDIEGVIARIMDQLKSPTNRVETLAALLKFAGPQLHRSGSMAMASPNTKLTQLQQKAAAAVHSHAYPETVGMALAHRDRGLRSWAVGVFGNTNGAPRQWQQLLPQLRKVAVEDDYVIRSVAVHRLLEFPENNKFLEERIEAETSPTVLMHLLRWKNPQGDTFKGDFLRRFAPLLSHPDESVRHEALLFVGFNSHRAEMWQFSFGKDVFDKVIDATRSQSASERADAVYALTDICNFDLDGSREALLPLARDPESDVRWRLAFPLAHQLDRQDVQSAIAALIKDENATVRYMTIVAAGPEKYVKELQALARGPDAQIAEWAAQKLKQISPK